MGGLVFFLDYLVVLDSIARTFDSVWALIFDWRIQLCLNCYSFHNKIAVESHANLAEWQLHGKLKADGANLFNRFSLLNKDYCI